MPSRAQRERSDRRRALRLLADAPEGVTEALMLAHGFRVELLVDLCFAGLAIAKPEHMRGGTHDGGRSQEDHGGGVAGAHRQTRAITKKPRVYKLHLVGGKVMMRRFNRLDAYAPKTKRVPTAERITLLGSSARTKS